MNAELDLVRKAWKEQKSDVKMLWRWLSDRELRQRCDESIAVESDFVSAATLIRMQQRLMQKMLDKGVLVEALPSSNIRISLYHNFHEHHLFRWLKVPGFSVDGDPAVMVSLGSDDPGIFAGDLRSEFYQLFSVLRQSGLDDQQAMSYLRQANERGREYRFHQRRDS